MSVPLLQNYGPDNVDEILTLTMANLMPGIKDNIFKENTALGWLYKNAKKGLKGGASISHGLHYGLNNTAQSYSRYDILNVTPQNNFTRDQWVWKQYSVSVSIDGFSERINNGDQKIDDVMEEKRKEAEFSIKDLLERHTFAASPGALDLRSLPVIVLDSGTEGSVNGTTSSWWQSQVLAAGSWASGVGRSKLTTMVNTISKINPVGNPEVLLSDQTSYEAYEATLVSQYRYMDDTPDIGAKKLAFKEIPWIWSVQGTSGVIYCLTSDAIYLNVHEDTDFKVGPFIQPYNQDAKTAKILWMASLNTSNRRKLGKTTANAA